MKPLLNKIEFWIVLFFLIRLIGIMNPPLEIGHNWRQATGLMVSRNFLEVDANILYPRVDDNNGETGIIGMEFPSMNYIYFGISKFFGYTHWYGRLINLIVSSLGLLFFSKLIRLAGFSKKIALTSTILLTVSIWFTFSRKMMPDTYCISLMFIGLYYGLKYLETNKIYQLILFILISSLAILSKIPAGIYLVFLIPFVLDTKHKFKPRLTLALSASIPVFLAYLWYFVWDLKLSKEYGNWFNLGKPIATGFREISENLGQAFHRFYFDAFSSYVVFSFFAIGLVFLFIKKDKKMMIAFLLPFVVFLVYIFKSGFFFYHHNYYIIPFVPVMALVAGYALSHIEKKWLYLTLLIFGVVEGIGNQQHDFFIKKTEKYKMTLEPIMDKVSKRNELILINGNENPQLIYLSHRKGWNCSDDQLSDTTYLKNVIAKNCKFIVINKHSKENISLPYNNVFENDDFLIFETNAKPI